jgi:hypothetical protein
MLKPAASEPGSKSNSGKIPIPKGISGKPPSNLQQYYVAVGSADDKMVGQFTLPRTPDEP